MLFDKETPPHPSPLPLGERVLGSRNCQRMSERIQGKKGPCFTTLVT